MRSSTGASGTSEFALVLWSATAVIELLTVATASGGFPEVADTSPFGRPGTAVVMAVVAVVAVAGAVAAAWAGVTRVVRAVIAALTFAAAGITAVMVLYFLIAGGAPIILGVLLAHAAVSMALIGRAVLRAASAGTGR